LDVHINSKEIQPLFIQYYIIIKLFVDESNIELVIQTCSQNGYNFPEEHSLYLYRVIIHMHSCFKRSFIELRISIFQIQQLTHSMKNLSDA